jgi:sulfide:quinone oxidoreductase
MGNFQVVICGGGVAALEGALRLQSLTAGDLDTILLAPSDAFVYRPLAVREAVEVPSTRRYELWDLAQDVGVEWVKDALASVDRDSRVVRTAGGKELNYDALLLAVGGRLMTDLDHVLTFHDAHARQVHDEVIQDVMDGRAKSVAFIVPEGPVYPLPAYELALMTAERARRAGVEVELFLVTAEPHPLAAFGGMAGTAVTSLLQQAGVKLCACASPYTPEPGRLLVQPQCLDVRVDRIVAIPRVSGPDIPGVPGGGAHGFIPIDEHCAVPGTDGRVFAAGDATAFPIKHGGLAAQQADTAAAGIARLAGAGVEPAPFRPELRAKLLTGREPIYLSARLVGGEGFDTEVFDQPPWPVDDKVIAEELGPYLAGIDNR